MSKEIDNIFLDVHGFIIEIINYDYIIDVNFIKNDKNRFIFVYKKYTKIYNKFINDTYLSIKRNQENIKSIYLDVFSRIHTILSENIAILQEYSQTKDKMVLFLGWRHLSKQQSIIDIIDDYYS